MPTSSATVTTQNMELSPMRVSFGTAGSEVDLGGTNGNVVVSIKTQKADILADQSGKTVRDRRVSGQMYQVTTELNEIQNKDIWKVVFPHAIEIVSGGNKMIYFQSQIGDSDLANAKSLTLHPLSKQNSDLSGNFKFYLAVASAESEITWSPEKQATLKIVWNILPDTTSSPERFFIYGDPTIGIVNAAAGSPAYGGGNTGNGTVSGQTAYNGFTKTETITGTCLHAATNAGTFEIHGSVSGPLGLATVGIAFSAPQISFTINDGATDWAYNDTFTIATTAANYA